MKKKLNVGRFIYAPYKTSFVYFFFKIQAENVKSVEGLNDILNKRLDIRYFGFSREDYLKNTGILLILRYILGILK